ncbi:MAG: oligosaccharide flippase family protein [Verrucomicrobiota bacterium JB022]|nr:oligosaccharide flippase family protein [Verrucomicrobiota bacterium JB022]
MKHSRKVQAAALSIGKMSANLAGLLTMAVLARLFSQETYASYRQVLLAYGFVAPLLTLGIPKALYYFLPGAGEASRARLLENVLVLSGMGLVFGALLYFGGNAWLAHHFDNPALEPLLQAFALYPVFLLPSLALPACLVVQGKAMITALYSIISRLLIAGLVIGVALYTDEVGPALQAMVIGTGIMTLVAFVIMWRAVPAGNGKLSFKETWQQVRYSAPLGLTNIMGNVAMNLDKWIVAAMASPAAFAVFVNGAMQLPIVGALTDSITAVMLPEMSKASKSGDFKSCLPLWKRAAEQCAHLLFPVTAGLIILAPEAMVLLFGDAYAASAIPFIIYLSILPTRIVRFDAVFMATGRSGLLFKRTVLFLILTVITNVIFVRWMGPNGAALATVLCTLVFAQPYNLFFLRRAFQATTAELLPWKALGKIALAAGIAGAVGFAAKELVLGQSIFVRVAVAGITFALVYALLLHLTGLLPWQKVRDRLARVRREGPRAVLAF